jgi:hypothetical protein
MRRYDHIEDSFVRVTSHGDGDVYVDPKTGAFVALVGDPDTDGYCVSSETLAGLMKNLDAAEKRAENTEKKVKREPIPILQWGTPQRAWGGNLTDASERFIQAHITALRADTDKAMVKIGDQRPEAHPYGTWYRDMSGEEKATFLRLKKASIEASEAFEAYAKCRQIQLTAYAKQVWGIT